MINNGEKHNSNDHIVRLTAADGMVRGFFASTKDMVGLASGIHKTSAVMSAALGRLLTAGAMMGLMLKNDSDLITLNIKGDGPGEGALVTANHKGNVKGYVTNPAADIPNKAPGKLNVGGAIGEGTLTVIKDTGAKEPFTGTVQLVTGEIADDITYYFAQSEQTPSIVALGVLVDTDYTIRAAGGFIIQLMPGASDEIIDYLEKKMSGISSVTDLLDRGETPESIADMIFSEIGYEILETTPVSFECDCSRDRVEKALISIGIDELTKIRDEDGKTTLSCQFCNKEYEFGYDDLSRLIESQRRD